MIAVALAAALIAPQTFHVKPLRHWEIHLSTPSPVALNPSGIVQESDSWLVVSDKKEHPHLYRLVADGAAFRAEPFLPLRPPEALGASDLEGLARCRGRFWIAEEAGGAIIEVDSQGAAVSHPLDLNAVHAQRSFAPASGTKGAGLEGIACDETGSLYVANERQYRMIYVVDPATFKVTDFFDVPGGWNLPRFEGTTPVYPDFADLYFEAPFLYALQRNDRLVLKIDPAAKRLVAVLNLRFKETDFYDDRSPFGMAEGLAMTKDGIFILLDNNDTPLKNRPTDASALLLEFKRPSGF